MKNIKFVLFYMIISIFITAFSSVSVMASADNSLSKLKIDGVELSPAFSYSRLKYNGTVENNVTHVNISAVPSNSKANIIGIYGNTNLKVGNNMISVIVRAQNGKEATYKINLERKAAPNNSDSLPAPTDTNNTANTVSLTQSASKTVNNSDGKIKKLKNKLRKKNEKIRELKDKVSNLDDENRLLQGQYQAALSDNKKILSERIFWIILSIVLAFITVISLFVGAIKKSTKKYIQNEFDDVSNIPTRKKRSQNTRFGNNKLSEFGVKDDNQTNNQDDYVVVKKIVKTDEDLISSIEKIIADEIRDAKKNDEAFSGNLSESFEEENTEDDVINTDNERTVAVNLESSNSDNQNENKDNDDDFHFDIIEI